MPREPLKLPPVNGLPVHFQEAIRAAEARGVVLPDVYYGVLQGIARQLAFSIAGIAAYDQLQAVKDSLVKATATGQTFAQWQREIAVQDLGLPKHRLDNIFRTNLQSHYQAGHWDHIEQFKHRRPYLLYDAINDSRVRPTHLAMDGIIRPVDDPFWKEHAPPNGYRSILPQQRVSGNVLLGLKAFYSGKAVEIAFDSGGSIAVTTQHPILTRRGWVMSNNIKIDDEIVCYGGEISSRAPSADLNENNLPPTIEQIFNTLSAYIRTTAPRAAVDLYGDVEFIDGDVHIVGADRELMRQIDATTSKLINQFKLACANKKISDTSGFGPFMRIFSASAFLGCFRRFLGPFGDFLTPMIEVPLGLARNDNVVIHEEFGYPFRTDMQFLGDGFNSSAVKVHLYDAFWYWLQKFRAGLTDQFGGNHFSSLRFGPFDASITDIFIGSFGVNPDALGSIRNAHPGKVKFDRVVNLRFFDYCGHVYDLETKSGNILAYGGECNNHYVLSNCRCGVIALTEAQAKARSKGGDGLNKAIDETQMQPDKGWDYSPRDRLHGAREALDKRLQNNAGPLTNALDAAVMPVLHPPQDLRDDVTKKYFNGMVDIHDPEGLLPRYSLDASRIAEVVGAPDGSLIAVSEGEYALEFDITNALLDEAMVRKIIPGPDGARIMYNENFILKTTFQGQGIGARSFARQVSVLAESNFSRIETYAAGAYGERLNGYYTWAILGYDAPLTAEEIASLPDELQAARTVLDLLVSEAGRAWWEINGGPRPMAFDLADNSRSRQVLQAYLNRKGIRL